MALLSPRTFLFVMTAGVLGACSTTVELGTSSTSSTGNPPPPDGTSTGMTDTTSGTTTGGVGGGYTQCGGVTGAMCAPDEWCDFGGCAEIPDQSGVCMPRPQTCPQDCTGACGCDGLLYCNACEAAAHGVNVSGQLNCEPDMCFSLSTSLAMHMPKGDECTTIVYLDHSLTFWGYWIACGPGTMPDEKAAMSGAINIGLDPSSALVNGPNPPDEFDWRSPKMDFFAVASVRSSQTLLAGSMDPMGSGKIVYPGAPPSDPSQLGQYCMPMINSPLAPGRGYGVDGMTVDAVMTTLWNSALPDAIAMTGIAHDVYVISALGGYVAFVNSGP